jgi:hypothetical protein
MQHGAPYGGFYRPLHYRRHGYVLGGFDGGYCWGDFTSHIESEMFEEAEKAIFAGDAETLEALLTSIEVRKSVCCVPCPTATLWRP